MTGSGDVGHTDVLAAARDHTVKVGVRVAAALAAVDHVQVLEREVERARKRHDAVAQRAFRQRRELVKERLDDQGVEHGAKEDDQSKE